MNKERWNGRRLPKYVIEDVDQYGNIRAYFRRKGQPKIRLPGMPFTEEFMRAYSAALSGRGAAPRHERVTTIVGSLRAIVEGYYGSAEFKLVDARTQRVRRQVLDALCLMAAGNKTAGDLPFRLMEPRHIRKWRDARAETPEAANSLIKYLRQVCAYAVANDFCDRNAAREVPYIKTGSTGFHSWTIEEVCQFENTHPIGGRGWRSDCSSIRRSGVLTLFFLARSTCAPAG